MCTRATLAEVRKLQKAAGILNENDIDYSLDEMLDDEGMLNEKRQLPPCGYYADYGNPGHASCCGVRYMLDGDPAGRSTCLPPYKQPDFKVDGYSLVKYMPENVQEPSLRETGAMGVSAATPCGPNFTALSVGPKPGDFACFPNKEIPKQINGKPVQKKVLSTTASKPGAPVPLKEKAPLPGCGPMWDGQKAVEGVRWMLDGDPGRHSTCLLPGRKPDFKVEFGGRLYSLVPYTNQESVQEAIGASGISAAAPCGPTFTAISIGPKPTDYACFPTNGLPQKINGKPIQKKVASTTAPTAGAPAPLKEKMSSSPVNDQWCTERYGRAMTAYSCEHAGGWRTCMAANAPMDWFCDRAGRIRPEPVKYMHEGTDMTEGVTSTTCPPLPDGTKTVAFMIGPKPTDFICAPATAQPTGKNKQPLKKVGGPTVAPKPGMPPQI